MKKVRVRRLQGEKLKIEGNLVLKKGKIYVSKNKKLRVEIICVIIREYGQTSD